VGSGSAGQPQGPATPPPPVEAPPPPPPPPPPKIDWAAYLAADPGYAATLANLQSQEANLLTQYGAVPTGVTQIGSSDAVSGDIANAAKNNPYSTLSTLANQLKGNIHSANDSANAHGVLMSGINLRNQKNEYAADQQRQYSALSALQSALLGLGGQQSQALEQARQNWFNYYNSGVPSG
jgi:hypothetical protein